MKCEGEVLLFDMIIILIITEIYFEHLFGSGDIIGTEDVVVTEEKIHTTLTE